MKNKTVKDYVADGALANFVRYQGGLLIYKVKGLEFAIPIEDTGSGIFPAQIKAITLMRWIRKHLAELE